jgi:hypothetical protein
MQTNKSSLVERIQYSVYLLIQAALVVAFFISVYETSWEIMFISVVALLAIRLPSILARNIRIHLPIEFEVIIALFIYSSLILGEFGFYARFWWWDLVLHAFAGLALGFIGFLVIYSIFKHKRLTMSPGLIAWFSFFFAVSLGVVWEMFEFTMDATFGLNMQKGLGDTMWDLIVNTLGAIVASVAGYYYLRRKLKGGIFEHYLNVFLQKNKQTISPPVRQKTKRDV